MENLISSFFSGFGKVLSDLFGSPLDFLTGKSCSTVCGTTWDLICYIENFCVSNLLKLLLVFVLFYIVLLFFCLTYKLGIFHCLAWTCCRMVWGCFSMCFSCVEYSCSSVFYSLRRARQIRRGRRMRDIENRGSTSEEEEMNVRGSSYPDARRSFSRRDWRGYKRDRLRRSLRPRNHRTLVGIGGDYNRRKRRYHWGFLHNGDNDPKVGVYHISKFAQKGRMRKTRFKL